MNANDAREPFVEMLRGNSNSLGRTEEVVAAVLASPERAAEVYELFFQPDEWVRLRAASASKRLWRADRQLFAPYVAGWVEHVATLDQPSAQWTFANLCDECEELLTAEQRARATEILVEYLAANTDWIVLNSSMPPLVRWAADDAELADRVRPHLERLSGDERASVAKRATKLLAVLGADR